MPRRRRIDPTSSRPKYLQLADILRASITSGERRPGDQLPSERSLSQQHELGIDTVKDALAVLRREGLIITRRGQRAQVRPTGEPTVTRVGPQVRIKTRMPTDAERRRMGLDEGTPVFVISRTGQEDEVIPGGPDAVIETTADGGIDQ